MRVCLGSIFYVLLRDWFLYNFPREWRNTNKKVKPSNNMKCEETLITLNSRDPLIMDFFLERHQDNIIKWKLSERKHLLGWFSRNLDYKYWRKNLWSPGKRVTPRTLLGGVDRLGHKIVFGKEPGWIHKLVLTRE